MQRNSNPYQHQWEVHQYRTDWIPGRRSVKVSKSLANNSQFDIVLFVVNEMSESIARFLEAELLHGTDAKVEGLKGVTLSVETAAASAVTMDEIIMLKDKVKDAFQAKPYSL